MFASWGDNITPPQQALNWIPDLYDSVDEIRAQRADHRLLPAREDRPPRHLRVGRASPKRETAELVSALELIDTLPPGLYEAVIDGHAARHAGASSSSTGRYLIRFEPRTIDDILALDDGREDEQAFEVVKRVSQINQGLYDTFVSPVVKAMSNEATARGAAR